MKKYIVPELQYLGPVDSVLFNKYHYLPYSQKRVVEHRRNNEGDEDVYNISDYVTHDFEAISWKFDFYFVADGQHEYVFAQTVNSTISLSFEQDDRAEHGWYIVGVYVAENNSEKFLLDTEKWTKFAEDICLSQEEYIDLPDSKSSAVAKENIDTKEEEEDAGYWDRYDETSDNDEGTKRHTFNDTDGGVDDDDDEDSHYKLYDEVETAVRGDSGPSAEHNNSSKSSSLARHTRQTILNQWQLCSEEMSLRQFEQVIQDTMTEIYRTKQS